MNLVECSLSWWRWPAGALPGWHLHRPNISTWNWHCSRSADAGNGARHSGITSGHGAGGCKALRTVRNRQECLIHFGQLKSLTMPLGSTDFQVSPFLGIYHLVQLDMLMSSGCHPGGLGQQKGWTLCFWSFIQRMTSQCAKIIAPKTQQELG